MKSVDRLVSTRKSQRDVAAEHLLRARRRLDATTSQKEEIDKEHSDKIDRAVGNDSLSIQDLERMDIAQRSIQNTVSNQQKDVGAAKEVAMASHQKLRQMEIWREKIEARQLKERQTKERKQTDEFAMRNAKKVAPLLVAISLLFTSGCKDEAKNKAKEAAKVDKKKTDAVAKDEKKGKADAPKAAETKKAGQTAVAGQTLEAAAKDKTPPATTPAGAENQVSGAELVLLRKLRQRSEELDRHEATLKAKTAELKRLEEAAKAALAALKNRQDDVLGKTTKTKMPKVVIVANSIEEAELKGLADAAAEKKKADEETAAKAKAKLDADAKRDKGAFLKLVRGLNARKAAAMMTEMDTGKAAGVLNSMTPQESAKILAQIPAAEAAQILEAIQKMRTGKPASTAPLAATTGGGK